MADIQCTQCSKWFNSLLNKQLIIEVRSQRVSSNISYGFCSDECKDLWYKTDTIAGIFPIRNSKELVSKHVERHLKVEAEVQARLATAEKEAGRALAMDEVLFLSRAIDIEEPKIDMAMYLMDSDEDLTVKVSDGKENVLDAGDFKTPEELNSWWSKG